MYLLDTMVLDWLATGSRRLGPTATALIEGASPGSLIVSVISFWEIGLLLKHKRLRLNADVTVGMFRQSLLSRGVAELPLSGPMVLMADGLADFHQDTGDRFIVASAAIAGATLITSDEKILGWSGKLARLDATT